MLGGLLPPWPFIVLLLPALSASTVSLIRLASLAAVSRSSDRRGFFQEFLRESAGLVRGVQSAVQAKWNSTEPEVTAVSPEPWTQSASIGAEPAAQTASP